MDRIASNRRSTLWICVLLGVVTLGVFWAVGRNDFVIFDDPDYVSSNPVVLQGFSRPGVTWAITTFHASNWHPLTWLSHILDGQLYGSTPAGHHFTNLLLHAANAGLLFLVFNGLTGAPWR